MNESNLTITYNMGTPKYKSFPAEKVIKLRATQAFDLNLVRENPAEMENYIRSELALKLAKELIEEDVISFSTITNPATNTLAVAADIEAIQGER